MERERDEKPDRRFERGLSAAGAVSLLAIALLGPSGLAVAVLAFAVLIVVVASAPPSTPRRRPIPISRVALDDRWQVWRRVEPDPEYLRGGRRRRAA